MSWRDKKKEYLKEYRLKNIKKIRAYKKEWNRLHRTDTKMTKEERWEKFHQEFPRPMVKIRNGYCQRCEIRLDSEYSSGGDDKLCGDCLVIHRLPTPPDCK